MTQYAFLIFCFAGLVGAVFASGPWRNAFLATLVVGFLQDPLRKIVPEQPILLVMLSTVMMLAALVGAATRAGPIRLAHLTFGDRNGSSVISLYISLVILQGLVSLIRYGSLQVAGIGMIFYLTPIPVIWLASRYVRNEMDVRRFLSMYVVMGVGVGISIHLAVAGVDSILLEEVGEGLVIYDWIVGKLRAHSGFMRSSEVAAWHLGTTSCLLIVLAVSRKSRVMWSLVPFLVAFLLSAAVYTGRRKSLVAVAVFVIVYFALLVYYRQRTGTRVLALAAFLGLAIITGSLILAPDDPEADAYVTRGSSVWVDIMDRFYSMGLGSLEAGFNRAGILGLGAGSVSQGAQNFGGAMVARGAAEGGLGKVVIELGIPGLVLLLLVIWYLSKSVRRVLNVARKTYPAGLRLQLGLLALCIANVPVFIGASQVFGDPFILFILGSCFGMVFGTPRLIESKLKADQKNMIAANVNQPA